jgi:hypothetical protein
MATSVFFMPIVPGKEDFDRETLQRLASPGPEHDRTTERHQIAGSASRSHVHA